METKRLAAVIAVTAIVAAACGGDGVGAETTAFCDAVRNVDTVMAATGPEGEPPPDYDETAKSAMAAALDAAPDEVRPSVQTLVDLTTEALDAGGDMFSLFLENEDFSRAGTALDDWMVENCGYAEQDVVGVNYAYSGMPDAVKAGVTGVRFANQGTEFHEMVLVRVDDGVTESLDELLALPEEEASAKVEDVGVAFAAPGTTDTAFYDLEPGRYAYFCFLPEGSTPENLPGLMEGSFQGGPPHFTLGMKGEFTVEG